jgi:hypothetical protein
MHALSDASVCDLSLRLCDYFIATNADNLYNREFVKNILPEMQSNKLVILCAALSPSHCAVPFSVSSA